MIDLTGFTFNRLKVVSLNRKENFKNYWNCICICGKEKIVDGSKLKSGHTKSCGCLRKDSALGRKRLDLAKTEKEYVGKIFGKLTVTGIYRKKGIIRANCFCSCGKDTEATLHNILRGHTKSCGCNRHVSLIRYAKENAGEKNKGWKGGVKSAGSGYLQEYSPGHPKAYKNYVSQHRLVMEGMLGRYLLEDESVHHKNGVRNDNRPSNLELWTKAHPSGQRVEDILSWCVETLKKYKPELLKETQS